MIIFYNGLAYLNYMKLLLKCAHGTHTEGANISFPTNFIIHNDTDRNKFKETYCLD
jgi:hypothetical protein